MNFLTKLFYKFHFMEGAYESRENSNEFSYLVEKFLAKKTINLIRSRIIGNGMKMFENFWRKSSLICRKIQTNQKLMNNFHRAQKFKKATSKILRVWTKDEEKNSRKFCDFLIKISMEN